MNSSPFGASRAAEAREIHVDEAIARLAARQHGAVTRAQLLRLGLTSEDIAYGFAFHGHRAAFERDRARDADLQAAGLRVVRLTWRQLTQTPEAAAIRLAAMLASTAAPRS